MKPVIGRTFYRDVLEHLGFPKNCLRAKIIIEPDEIVTVECELALLMDNAPPMTTFKKYKLFEKDEQC